MKISNEIAKSSIPRKTVLTQGTGKTFEETKVDIEIFKN
jgi:hypothetical protein